MRDMNLRENWPRGFGSSIAQDVARLSLLNLSTMTPGRGVELYAPGLRSGYLDGGSAGRARLAGNRVQQRFRPSMPAGEDEHHAGWPSLAAAFLPTFMLASPKITSRVWRHLPRISHHGRHRARRRRGQPAFRHARRRQDPERFPRSVREKLAISVLLACSAKRGELAVFDRWGMRSRQEELLG